MRLREQFHDSSGPSPRSWRYLLDALAPCENLPLALVRLGNADNAIQAGSFTAPLFDLLRSRRWFREHEHHLFETALRTGGDDEHGALVVYSDHRDGRVQAYLLPTDDPEFFLLCGPVWLRHPESLREPFTQDFVGRAAERIMTFDRQQPDSEAEPRLSPARVRRVLQHRAAMTANDFRERVSHIRRTIEVLMDGETPARLNADQIERVALALSFWGRRLDLLDAEPAGCPLLAHQSDDASEAEMVFIVNRSDADDPALKFTIMPRRESRHREDLFLRPSVADKWSFFSDTYRSNRNVYYLERMLLIRLWLQDKFSGISAEAELGGQKSRKLLQELMRRLQQMLGADACALYAYTPGETHRGPAGPDQRSGVLHRLASYYDPGSKLRASSEAEARKMEVIGTDPEDRGRSNSYCALDQKKTLYNPDLSPDDLVSIDSEVAPRTVLSTPLISRGCAWGVIEILGCSSHQFPFGNIRWIEELARILTPILFDQWQTYRLREISRLAMADNGPIDLKYKHVLDHIRKLLLASSARLYLQSMTDTVTFTEKAHAGQAWPADVAGSFTLNDTESASAGTIAEQLVWKTGEIGHGDFVERGPERPLGERGHKGCAIIPIYNGRGNCFATVMLTSTDNLFSPDMWQSTVEAVSGHLNVVLEAIHLQDTRVEARQTYFAHTIKTRATRVEGGAQRLLAQLDPLLSDAALMTNVQGFANEVETIAALSRRHGSPALSQASREVLQALRETFPPASSHDHHRIGGLAELVADLRSHLSEIRKSVVFIAGGANQEDAREADPETWDGTWADLRSCLLTSLKPLQNPDSPRSNLRVPERFLLPHGVKIRIPASILIEVLNNLVDNAIKYDFSPPSSNLKVRIDSASNQCRLEFRNMAPRISDEEWRQMDQRTGQRATYAKRKNADGSGVGLRFIRDIGKAWKFGFEYVPPLISDPAGHGPMGWHSLTLTFNTVTED